MENIDLPNDHYFNDFGAKMLATIEIERVAPTLARLNKKSVVEASETGAPPHYFEHFAEIVLRRIHVSAPLKVVHSAPRRWLYFAAAAVLAAVCTLPFLEKNTENEALANQNTALSVETEGLFAEINTDEVVDFLKNNANKIDETTFAKHVEKLPLNHFQDVASEEIATFVDDNAALFED